MPVENQSSAETNRSPSDGKAVSEQLERILASPLFRQSKRYSPFLRYVVEKTLAGEADTLKERTLGVEIFGRAPNYDSSNDPVVRVTAGEVRKRIAQYYHDAEHKRELRIELSPGSYVPEFMGRQKAEQAPVIENPLPRTQRLQADVPPATSEKAAIRVPWVMAAIVFAIILAGIVGRWPIQRSGVVDLWWQPAFHSTNSILLSVGTIEPGAELNPALTQQSQPPSSSDTVAGDLVRNDHVGLVDAIALETFAAMFSSHKQSFHPFVVSNHL